MSRSTKDPIARVRPALPPEVARRLGPYYVYALVDPRDDRIFYIGKGTGTRLLAHGIEADLVPDPGERKKLVKIKAIRSSGLEPRIEVVRHGLDEKEAFLLEAAFIDTLPDLTNKVLGHDVERGRAPLSELVIRYGARPLEAVDPAVLMIRLTPRWKEHKEEMEPGYFREGAGWYPEMTQTQLYDSVRGWWKVSPKSVERSGVRHAVAVVEGVTRAIYEIKDWVGPSNGRWAFIGDEVIAGELWEDYVGPWGRRVPFAAYAQNPLIYWPVRA